MIKEADPMLFEQVQKVIAEQLNVKKEDIKLDSVLTTDLGANSLDLVNLITDCEEKFNIEIPEEDLRKFITVKDVVVYLENLAAQKKG
jgi:acyl carrier protein